MRCRSHKRANAGRPLDADILDEVEEDETLNVKYYNIFTRIVSYSVSVKIGCKMGFQKPTHISDVVHSSTLHCTPLPYLNALGSHD